MFGMTIPEADRKAILKARDEAKAKNPQRLLHRVGHTICLSHPHEVLWSRDNGIARAEPKPRPRRQPRRTTRAS